MSATDPRAGVWTCTCGLTRPRTLLYGCIDCGDSVPYMAQAAQSDLAGPRCSECHGWHFGRPCPPASPADDDAMGSPTYTELVPALSLNNRHALRVALHRAMAATGNSLVWTVLAVACLDIPTDPAIGPCQACRSVVRDGLAAVKRAK